MPPDPPRTPLAHALQAHASASKPPLTVEQIMLTPVAVLRRGSSVRDALRVLRQLGSDTLVVDPLRRGARFGLLTLRDIDDRVVAAGRDPDLVSVGDLMTSSLLVVAPAMRAEDCATLMLAAEVRRAIVVRDGRPVGVICDTDIFQAIESRR